jgi:hypothetical protein
MLCSCAVVVVVAVVDISTLTAPLDIYHHPLVDVYTSIHFDVFEK